MTIDKLVSKYIASADHVFSEITVVEDFAGFSLDDVRRVLELAKAYLQDAKYYRDHGKLEVSLASVAYCEGLLDALKMLGMVKFEWPRKKEEAKSGEKSVR
ncbi:MAG: DUF357 domain-containing protein [Candidatus Bathyarchaeia archaeon]